jgi:flagellar hook-associated protein 2
MAIDLNTVANPVQPTLTSTGLGSGIDVNSLTTNLVNATIGPQQTLIKNKQASDQATISALGTVQSALIGLETAVNSLTSGGALQSLSAATSNPNVFTAAAGSAAVAGTYTVKVQSLAQGNAISSGAYSSASASVGAGVVTINAGGSNFSVTLTAGQDTLQDLANAINKSPDNSGVSASIITSVDGAHLVLNATQTGVANAVSVSSSPLGAFSTVQSASDAQIFVDGFEYDSSSNTVTGALSGVTLNLEAADPNVQLTLRIAANTTAAASAVQSFVTAYNTALSLLSSSTAYDSTTKTAGPLIGNAAVNAALQQIKQIVGSKVVSNGSNAITSLSQLGVSAGSDGSLQVDSTKLNAALSQNLGSVQNLFSGDSGIGTRLSATLERFAGASGILDSETSHYQTDYSNLQQKLAGLTTESDRLTQRYLKEFNNMNSIVSQYNSLSNMLTQTFANWNNVTTNKNGG